MLTVTNLTSVDYLIRNLPLTDATMLGDIIAETIEVVNDVVEVPYTEDELRGFTLRGFEDFLADQIDGGIQVESQTNHEDENVIRYERFVEILERLTYRED